MIRVLASDLDGTLLDKKCRISAETAEAVEMAQRAGIRFVAATGRAWGTAYPFFQKAGIKADYVLLNGAEFRASSGTIIYQETIQRNAAERIMDYLSVMDMDFEVNTNKGDFSTNTKMCPSASDFPNPVEFWGMKPKILKIFVFSEEPAILEKMKTYLRGWKEIFVTSSDNWNIEITAANAQKGKMLKKVTEFYQISADEVMVFGDGENDETMFREFPHSCAVENAAPVIRSLAEKVIESNQNNGVAKEIYQIIGL